MRALLRAAMLETMSSRLHLTLDLEAEAEPISGTFADPDGRQSDFVGWVGLAAALGEILDREARRRQRHETGGTEPTRPG